MKAVMIVYNEAIEQEVANAVASAGVEEYTKMTGVLGSGAGSGPRLGDSVWPGANNTIFVIAEDPLAGKLTDVVAELRKSVGDAGLRAFWWTVEGML